jgi:cation diffusion facilitator CzcD-associated flavoprotein CzcO
MDNRIPNETEIAPAYFDVIIVGAGLSGIGAAHFIQDGCPHLSYSILEMRETLGGTWSLFQYPGIRSDSDMYTLGYKFRPWKDAKAIADGPSILQYLDDTAREDGNLEKIQFNRRLTGASWSGESSRWTLQVNDTKSESIHKIECNFLFMCSGYYSYEEGYTPDFKGMDTFGGRVVHPQKWTDDVDYTDKKVVVIGSGATAVTLVPELAKKARLVTMLQRSPSYIFSTPSVDRLANFTRRILPGRMAYSINRWRKALLALLSYKIARKRPETIKKFLKKRVRKALGDGHDIDTHFTPNYNPWDQRLCLVPDDDLFKVLKSGKAEMVTDHIASFTEKGLLLQSGKELEADLIVTATGLKLSLLDGVQIKVDGEAVHFPDHFMYRGLMVSDIPNMAIAAGYTNASWTLKTDLSCAYVCRMLNHMRKTGTSSVTARVNEEFISTEPLLDFNSGYVLRGLDKLPRQGPKSPWKLHQNYPRDVLNMKYSSITDKALEYK